LTVESLLVVHAQILEKIPESGMLWLKKYDWMLIQIFRSQLTSMKRILYLLSPQHSGSKLTLTHYVVCGILGRTKSKFLSVSVIKPEHL
jgi:hypothetical protein